MELYVAVSSVAAAAAYVPSPHFTQLVNTGKEINSEGHLKRRRKFQAIEQRHTNILTYTHKMQVLYSLRKVRGREGEKDREIP